MTFETGTDEIALENLQASKSRLRGDRELPTREEVELCIHAAAMKFGWNSEDIAGALIARGFLQVRG